MRKPALTVLIFLSAATLCSAAIPKDECKALTDTTQVLTGGRNGITITVSGTDLTTTAAFNSSRDRAAESGFTLRKHEIAAGGAFCPGRIVSDFIYYYCICDYYSSSKYAGLTNVFKNSTYDISKVTNSWWLSYTYNFSRIWSLGFLLSYDGYWTDYYGWRDSSVNHREDESILTPMVFCRVSWLNRRIVRMYSSFGAGILVNLDGEPPKFAAQITCVGISVGKKLYGYAEAGVGTVWFGGCAGIGYRF